MAQSNQLTFKYFLGGASAEGGSRLRVNFQDPRQTIANQWGINSQTHSPDDPNNFRQHRPVSFGGNAFPSNTNFQTSVPESNLANNRQFRDAQSNYEQQIQALESDKVSLMKRLNLVLSELESATHEKAAIGLRVADQERQTEELKRKLEEAAQLKQAFNRNIQDELRYERELNDKMRDEVNRYENEKEQIMGRLKDSEALTDEIKRETAAIKGNLQKRNEELRRLEREHQVNIERVRELSGQLEALRGQEMQGKGEKRRLEEELEELTREKDNLIKRMNDLNDRYNAYVQQMDQERANVLRTNKSHIKLLTAKLFYQLLNEKVRLQRKEAFQAMQNCSQQLSRVESLVNRFVRVLSEHHQEAKRRLLRQWYLNSMNFTHEHYKKLRLIDFQVAKRRKLRFFYEWREAYMLRQKKDESKVHSLVIICKLVRGRQELSIRNKICKWRDFVELRQYQTDALNSMLTRHGLRDQRTSFVRWLALVKTEQLQTRYDTMSTLISELGFKQRIFLSLKHACLQSRTERVNEKFTSWRQRCLENRDQNYFLRKETMVDRLQGVRAERLLKQCYDAIRYNNVLEKFEATRDRLNQEIPVRQDLERQRDNIIRSNVQKDKYNALRKCCMRYSDAKYRAIIVWKENISYLKRTMNRLKLRLIELHRTNLSIAFMKWREGSDRLHMIDLLNQTDDLMNENQNFRNTLADCHQEQERLAHCKFRQQVLKAERMRNIINRNILRRNITFWSEYTNYIASIEKASIKATKIIDKKRLKITFNRYRMKVKEVHREEHVTKKSIRCFQLHQKKDIGEIFVCWKNYIARYKNAKAFLLRSIHNVDRLISTEAFQTWKGTYFQSRRDVYLQNIAELQRRQRDHEYQIVQLNKQIQVNDSTQHHLESKLQTQSHRILANFIARFIHTSQARGFYTWFESLKEFRTKKRFLKSTLSYWIKQNLRRGFRTWAQLTMNEKERDIAQELASKEQERKDLQRRKDEEEVAQAEEIEFLSNQLEHSIQVKDQLKVNYEKALATHVSRVRNNVYVNKRRNIFSIWAEYIKKEKNAVNVIGALARQQLRMEVFSRIRLVARERFLESNAERIISNLFRTLKQSIFTKSFSKWRRRSYQDAVREMKSRKAELQQKKILFKNELEQMEKVKQAKAEKILRQRRQREITNQWIQMAKIVKSIRVKKEILQENIRYLQIKWAAKRWQGRTKLTNYLRRKNKTAIQKFKMRTLMKCYKQWSLRVQICKLFIKRLFKFSKRIGNLALAEGFGQIVHFSKSFKERDRERKEHSVQSSVKLISHLLKSRLCDAFNQLRIRSHKKSLKQEFLARMLRHVLSARMRHFFGKWKHNSDRIALAELVNTEGDVVLERNEMRRNVKALKEFLTTQGYTLNEIDNFILQKTEKQRQQMHRAIVGLFFKNSPFEIIPKALNQWKSWVQQRRLVKQWSRYTVNAMNHPLHWAFRKWKMSEEDARDKLKHVLKKDLINKIIDDELAIGSAQHRIERMDETIENLGIQRDSLLQHYIAGQRLALALGRNNHMRTLYRAFLKWKKETSDYEQALLLQQLDRTNLMIQDLMMHVDRLEGIQRNLANENEELRQAALDGIEIAKAVQDLTRERETLSQDLQERASTIKRLIEDNNTLAYRLNVAQKEAEQLEELNREAVAQQNPTQPERDRYY